jgi:hypothetical protein
VQQLEQRVGILVFNSLKYCLTVTFSDVNSTFLVYNTLKYHHIFVHGIVVDPDDDGPVRRHLCEDLDAVKRAVEGYQHVLGRQEL